MNKRTEFESQEGMSFRSNTRASAREVKNSIELDIVLKSRIRQRKMYRDARLARRAAEVNRDVRLGSVHADKPGPSFRDWRASMKATRLQHERMNRRVKETA